jgi:hypothetical protein
MPYQLRTLVNAEYNDMITESGGMSLGFTHAHGVTSQNIWILRTGAVKTSNLSLETLEESESWVLMCKYAVM